MPEATASKPLPAREHQFDNLAQQTEAAHLGMWLFLATEVLFFGALFVAYTVYRCTYPQIFAEAGRELNVWAGTLDTTILLTSSLTMVLSVYAAQYEKRLLSVLMLLATAAFGMAFLCLHGYEYYRDITEGHFPGKHFTFSSFVPANKAQLFFLLYFFMTGLHSLHVLIGVGVILVMAWFAWRNTFTKEYFTPVEVTGLYWHFVDLVWVFLFPLFYLIDRR